MSEYVVQTEMQGNSGLSKDRYTNTFHFTGTAGAATLDDAVAAAAKVAKFYSKLSGGWSIGNFIAKAVADLVVVKVYDWLSGSRAVGKKGTTGYVPSVPRPILYQNKFNLPARSTPDDIPEEVALCLSFTQSAIFPGSVVGFT